MFLKDIEEKETLLQDKERELNMLVLWFFFIVFYNLICFNFLLTMKYVNRWDINIILMRILNIVINLVNKL